MVAAASVLVTVAAGTVVTVLMLCLRLRDEEAPAVQAPVQTAMITTVTQIPTQHSGTRTAMTIPAITAPVMPEVSKPAKYNIKVVNYYKNMYMKQTKNEI